MPLEVHPAIQSLEDFKQKCIQFGLIKTYNKALNITETIVRELQTRYKNEKQKDT